MAAKLNKRNNKKNIPCPSNSRTVSNSSSDEIIEAVKKGRPVYLSPYKDPRIWGVGGIGEYWYGAEPGEKSSTAVVDRLTAPMAGILAGAPEAVLGRRVITKFGRVLPLVKILTPQSRLSVQFHDTKNELWIITGIDKALVKGQAELIIGFSAKAIRQYKNKVAEKYKEAVTDYARALNLLIDKLEDNGHKKLLGQTRNVVTAAEKTAGQDKNIDRLLRELKSARDKIEFLYNYRTVQTGDVIPIPAGTLHALGAGIQVVEPQIPGPTQAMEDGAVYPVRYYFPGYERPGAQKKLDIDRIDEIRPDLTQVTEPKVLIRKDTYTVEQLPGNFEDKGLEVHRLTLRKNAEITNDEIKSFHILTAVSGQAGIVIGGREYNIPNASPAGRMLLIPASAASYKITAPERAQAIDTFTPV